VELCFFFAELVWEEDFFFVLWAFFVDFFDFAGAVVPVVFSGAIVCAPPAAA